jgi:biotin-(acetyl-CoA carboxylase) ligase
MPGSADEEETFQVRRHSRNRSEATSTMADTNRRSKSKEKSNKPPSQKAMLSKALQKANTAVQLDNAQNFESARESYAEACGLLQQVLSKTSTEEDKRELEAIVSQLNFQIQQAVKKS